MTVVAAHLAVTVAVAVAVLVVTAYTSNREKGHTMMSERSKVAAVALAAVAVGAVLAAIWVPGVLWQSLATALVFAFLAAAVSGRETRS